MRKKFLIGVLSIVILSGLTGCTNNDLHNHETIVAYGKSIFRDDDININLKKGYWIKDYTIDYDKGQVIINLEKENNNEKDN
jgi:hypothetical protein